MHIDYGRKSILGVEKLPQTSIRRRILFVDHTAAMSGGEVAMLNLVQALDHERYVPIVVLFSEGPLATQLIAKGIETLILPLTPSVLKARKDSLGGKSLLKVKDISQILLQIRRLSKLIRDYQIDIVHTNSLKADIIGGLAARRAGTPVIWHIRDRIEKDYLPSPVVLIFRWLCRHVPDYVIANSLATLQTIKLGPKAHSATIPSGTPLPMRVFDTEVNAALNKTPDDQSDSQRNIRIGIVGRLTPWKGQHIFLRAAQIVHKNFPTAQFQIIGGAMFDETEYEQELRNLTTTLGLKDCVEFTGFRADVPDLIANLDILVHASTTGEPFGQVIIEGMAAGKPVVATNGGGVPEIVVDGVTGLLVPMRDVSAMAAAIQRILEEPELARNMGQSGFERVRAHFTVERTARSVEQIYESILVPSSSHKYSRQ